MEFTDALINGDLEAVRRCPKADLHNHFVLGGSRRFLRDHYGKDIQPITKPIYSMDEMHAWNSRNLGDCFKTAEGRRMLIRAAFSQAEEDGVTILEIGEDVWGLGEFSMETSKNLWLHLKRLIRRSLQRLNCGFRSVYPDIAA